MQKRPRPPVPTVGGILKEARLAKGMTLRSAAAACEISAGFYDDLERGRRTASLPVLRRVAKALGADVSKVVKLEARARIAKLKGKIEEIEELAS